MCFEQALRNTTDPERNGYVSPELIQVNRFDLENLKFDLESDMRVWETATSETAMARKQVLRHYHKLVSKMLDDAMARVKKGGEDGK